MHKIVGIIVKFVNKFIFAILQERIIFPNEEFGSIGTTPDEAKSGI